MYCEQTETSQQHINKHHHEEHGLLSCDICQKTCNTVSALRKHCYEHSDKVNRFPCQDCNKSFPFKSQLKSHRKVHLSALEHHCLLCKKKKATKMRVSLLNTWMFILAKPGRVSLKIANMNVRIHETCVVICIITKNQSWYKCERCGNGFNFYQEIKRHHLVNCLKKS